MPKPCRLWNQRKRTLACAICWVSAFRIRTFESRMSWPCRVALNNPDTRYGLALAGLSKVVRMAASVLCGRRRLNNNPRYKLPIYLHGYLHVLDIAPPRLAVNTLFRVLLGNSWASQQSAFCQFQRHNSGQFRAGLSSD